MLAPYPYSPRQAVGGRTTRETVPRGSSAPPYSAHALLRQIDDGRGIRLGDEAGAGRVVEDGRQLVALHQVEHDDGDVAHQILLGVDAPLHLAGVDRLQDGRREIERA